MNAIIQIHPKDNIAVTLAAQGDIPQGHKVALRPIHKGELVIKYGCPIGTATADIAQNAHVHSHNLQTNLSGLLEYSYAPNFSPVCPVEGETFNGFLRKDGRIGIRNEIWIVNTVGCVNKAAERMAALAAEKYAHKNIDGIFTFVHPYGCSQLGEDHLNTQKILKGMVNHPNAAGVLVFGLGCENNTIESFKALLGTYDPNRVKFLAAQDHEDEIEEGLRLIEELAEYAKTFTRQPVPVSSLCLGLKCGGSDGFSGITANPLAGRVSDMLAARGGTSLLTEVPEMFGAETLLMARCENRQIFDQCVNMINGFKKYFMRHGQEIYENPSPGNKAGGITTLEEKSLGCTQKGGFAPVSGVLAYGEAPAKKGLNLLNSPGNDIVAITALMAAGAHIILFTTGLGTPVGSAIPTVKIASNSALAQKKANWTDFNAGVMLEGKALEATAAECWAYIIAVAEGKQTQNERNNYREIAIFKDGVTL